MKSTILIVDDEDKQRELFSLNLEPEYTVFSAQNGSEALDVLASEPVDLVVTDLKMSGMDGIELIKKIKDDYPNIAILMMTAHGSISTAVEAMRLGAFDYLTKPFGVDELILTVERALEDIHLREENLNLKKQVKRKYGFENIIGSSSKMDKVFQIVSQTAESDVPVLILGKTGTGKELIARAIHTLSPRMKKPFICMNCAAIPEQLLESEFFGWEKGAFTDAGKSRQGKFEAADDGTIFLDEIGDMKLSLQAKLLRVIESGKVERLGGNHSYSVDVRVISSTNKDLEQMVADGEFREDLYYRLNVIHVQLPRLSERQEDLPLLIKFFLRKYGGDRGFTLDKNVREILLRHNYPGNVRELENIIRGAVVLSRDNIIREENLPPSFRKVDNTSVNLVPRTNEEFKEAKSLLREKAVEELEQAFVENALSEAGSNVSEAARRTGMNRRIFHRLMEKYGINEKQSEN